MISGGRWQLGVGSFGSCFKVQDPDTCQELVIKTFGKKDRDCLAIEADVLSKLQVAGVQQMVGVCVKTRQLVSHFAGQIAKDYFTNSSTSLPDSLSVIMQVARTLQRIHRKGYTHNDIKDNNVCVQLGSSGL